MATRFTIGVPIAIVGLGMGALFSLPVAMFSFGRTTVRTVKCETKLDVQVKKATMIFSGQVEAVLMNDDQADVWLRPDVWYKGQTVSTMVRITAPVSSAGGAKNDYNLASGQPPYLFFLRWNSNGKLITSRCYGTRFFGAGLTAAEKVLLAPAIKPK